MSEEPVNIKNNKKVSVAELNKVIKKVNSSNNTVFNIILKTEVTKM